MPQYLRPTIFEDDSPKWLSLLLLGLFLFIFSQTTAQQKDGFIHTDKSLYVTGETLWFSIYDFHKNGFLANGEILSLELWSKNGQKVMEERLFLKDGRAYGQFYLTPTISTGTYMLYASSEKKSPDKEATYSQTIYVINPQDASSLKERPISLSPQVPDNNLRISLPKQQFSQREKVEVSLNLSEELADNDGVDLSFSVFASDPSFSIGTQNILSHTEIIPSSEPDPSFLPITPYLEGQLKIDLDSVHNKMLFVAFPGTETRLFATLPDSQGYFQLPIPVDIRQSEVLFWMENVDLKEEDIVLPEVKNDEPPIFSRETDPLPIDSTFLNLIDRLSLHSQIANAYSSTHIRGLDVSHPSLETPFYGEADVSYRLDDYTRFPTMDEVFLEYIRYVVKKGKGEDQQFYVWDLYRNLNSISNTYLLQDPALVLLDGVPIRNLQMIWELDPLKVEYIDIITREYMVNGAKVSGIVHFKTYKNDFGGLTLPAGIVRKTYKPFLHPKKFYSPQYVTLNQISNRIPDYRNVLFWEPQRSFENSDEMKIQFYTGDVAMNYKIVVNGMSKQGIPIHGEASFSVSSNQGSLASATLTESKGGQPSPFSPVYSYTNDLLLNGKMYQYTYPNAEGDPFLESQAMEATRLVYGDGYFEGVEMNYDIYNDVFLTSFDEGGFVRYLILNNQKIQKVYLNGRVFTYIQTDSLQEFDSGMYEDVYTSPSWRYIIKHGKKRLKSSYSAPGSKREKFLRNERHYLLKGKQAFEIKNKKDLLQYLENSSLVKKTMKEEKMRLKKNTEAFRKEIIRLLSLIQ